MTTTKQTTALAATRAQTVITRVQQSFSTVRMNMRAIVPPHQSLAPRGMDTLLDVALECIRPTGHAFIISIIDDGQL